MFGRVFFVVVMLALFWLARRWNDDAEPAKAAAPSQRIAADAARVDLVAAGAGLRRGPGRAAVPVCLEGQCRCPPGRRRRADPAAGWRGQLAGTGRCRRPLATAVPGWPAGGAGRLPGPGWLRGRCVRRRVRPGQHAGCGDDLLRQRHSPSSNTRASPTIRVIRSGLRAARATWFANWWSTTAAASGWSGTGTWSASSRW